MVLRPLPLLISDAGAVPVTKDSRTSGGTLISKSKNSQVLKKQSSSSQALA